MEAKIDIRYFPGKLSFEVSQYIKSKILLSNAIPFNGNQENKTYCIIICPILGDNQIPIDFEVWVNNNFNYQIFFLVILADEDNHWRKRAVEFEMIRLLDLKAGRMGFQPLIIDSSQHKSFYTDIDIWSSRINYISSFNLNILSNLERSLRIGYSSKGYFFVDFATQEYYPKPVINEVNILSNFIQYLVGQIDISALSLKNIKFKEMNISQNIIEKIRHIDLSCNHMISIDFLNLFDLETLNMTACNLTKIPNLIKNQETLMHLQLCKNQIHDIDDLVRLKNLAWLSLYRSKINDISPVTECLNLKYLNLGANMLETLPQNISNLKNLEVINLRGCKFSKFPDIFLEMKNLKIINMEKNPLSLKGYKAVPKDVNFNIIL